jgi:hypothetical protein
LQLRLARFVVADSGTGFGQYILGGEVMKMTSKAAIVLAALLAFEGSPNAQSPPPAPPMTITVPDLTPDEFQPWIAKSNAYVELLNRSLRAIDSFRRYESWVDMKTGPTGKERYIHGLYSVDPGLAKSAIEKARAAADRPPAIPPLDAAARDYATAFETLVPILNDADAYYERQDYKDDQMAGGKAFHAKIVPAMNAFSAARARLEAGYEVLSAALDKQQLALIEKTEGKSERWQMHNLSIVAKAAIDAVPQDQGPDTMTTFSAAIAAYAEAVRNFDDFNKTAGKPDQTNPRTFLAGLRELRDKIDKKTAAESDFKNIVIDYNGVVEMINNYNKYN